MIHNIDSCFSKSASEYDKHHQVHKQSLTDALELFLKYCPSMESIHEVGCGTGEVLIALKTLFPSAQLTGSDLSLKMLKKAQEKLPEVEFLHTDALKIDHSVDCIISHFSLQWMHPMASYLEAFLKKARFVLISVPLEDSFTNWKRLHANEGLSPSLFPMPAITDFQNFMDRCLNSKLCSYPLSFSCPADFARYLKHIGANFSGTRGPYMLKKSWLKPNPFQTNYKVLHLLLKGYL